jgi:DNA-binding NarL/FixJ family response regulator
MIRIVIADDHRMMREGLRRIVEVETDMQVVGEAVNGFSALDHVKQGGFDLLLLDLSMPGPGSAQLVGDIRKIAPTLPLLIMTMYEDEAEVRQAISAGANGYLAKEDAGDHLVMAIHDVIAGHIYLPPALDED